MPRLIGNRIILREYQRNDLKYMRNWVNDSEIVKNLSDIFLYPHTEHATEQFLNSMLEDRNDNHKGFVIAHKETEEYIGQIDLFNISWKNRTTELGIVIGTACH